MLIQYRNCNFLNYFNCLFIVIDSPDVIFSDHTRKGKSKVYKNAEKVPLGENDELAMI